jgi:recombination protein RecA
MSKDGRQKALETTLASLNKRFGEGVVMKLGDATKLNVESIPSGSLSLDIALGVGGFPRGRVSRSTARKVPARRRSACM